MVFCGLCAFLCLMFKKTTPYFSKWLNYGLATMFSSALLAAMASISTDLVRIIAQSQYKYSKIASVTSIITGESVSGIFNSAMNQLGLGLMLSTVLIVVLPMAGSWFNGMMGTFASFNHFGGWNGSHAATVPSPGSGMPNTPPQTQGVSYQNDTRQINPSWQTMASHHMNTNQSGPSVTPSNLAVGVGRQSQQSEPTNQNNGRNNNGQA